MQGGNSHSGSQADSGKVAWPMTFTSTSGGSSATSLASAKPGLMAAAAPPPPCPAPWLLLWASSSVRTAVLNAGGKCLCSSSLQGCPVTISHSALQEVGADQALDREQKHLIDRTAAIPDEVKSCRLQAKLVSPHTEPSQPRPPPPKPTHQRAAQLLALGQAPILSAPLLPTPPRINQL